MLAQIQCFYIQSAQFGRRVQNWDSALVIQELSKGFSFFIKQPVALLKDELYYTFFKLVIKKINVFNKASQLRTNSYIQ
jgi:hypothetical protein